MQKWEESSQKKERRTHSTHALQTETSHENQTSELPKKSWRACFILRTEFVSTTSIQAEHGFDIYRPIVHVCDVSVTLLCIIAKPTATMNAG